MLVQPFFGQRASARYWCCCIQLTTQMLKPADQWENNNNLYQKLLDFTFLQIGCI